MTRTAPPLLILGLLLVVAPCAFAFDPADLNQDGIVDAADMGIFFHAWKDYRAGTPVASLPGAEPRADLNSDGLIDHNDFRAFLESFLSLNPSINLADYLVYNIGDQRYWVDHGGNFHWRDSVEAIASHPTWVNERHTPIMLSSEVDDLWWSGGGKIIAEGIVVGGVTCTYVTPMTLPATLMRGVPVTLSSDVSPNGHIDMTLSLLDVNQTASMGTVATWNGSCAKVEIVKDGTINGSPYHDDRIEWLAPGTGPVQEDLSPADPGTSIVTLQYLKVGSTTLGTLPAYEIIDLGTLTGFSGSVAYGINASGQVVGWAEDAVDTSHAFLWSGGTMTDLGTLPGGTDSAAYGINDSGQVVGWSGSSGSFSHAFLYSGGKMSDLNTLPAGSDSSANGINDSGQVVGWGEPSGGPYHAFLYSGGTMIDLGALPGGTASEAYCINDSGQVGGGSETSAGYDAFLYSGGTMTDLGTLPGGWESEAHGINDLGQVVGWSATSTGALHAFLYSGGKMTDLGTLPGGTDSEADGINDSGQVVGRSSTGDSYGHAFLYSGGTMTDLGTLPGTTYSQALGINDLGQIVGWSGTDIYARHAVLWWPTGAVGSVPVTVSSAGLRRRAR